MGVEIVKCRLRRAGRVVLVPGDVRCLWWGVR